MKDLIKKETKVQVQDVLTKLKATQIKTDDDNYSATKLLALVVSIQKQVKAEYEPEIKKLKEKLKEVQAQRDEWLEPVKVGEADLRGKVNHYVRMQAEAEAKRQREAAAKAAAEEKARAEAEAAGKPVPPPEDDFFGAVSKPQNNPLPKAYDGVSSTRTWNYEIVDASLIPRAYMKIDTAKIYGVVRSMKGETNIPGVRAYEDVSVRVRT